MNGYQNVDTGRRRLFCLVVFSLFSFVWLCTFQGYLVGYAYDKVISSLGGIVGNCNRFVMAAFVTAILDLMALGIHRIPKRPALFNSLDYLVPSIVLGIFTGFDRDFFFPQTSRQWIAAAVLAFSVLLIAAIIRYRNNIKPENRMIIVAANLLILLFEMLIAISLGNTDENLHRRVVMERYTGKEQFEKVLKVGYNESETDSKIELLRLQAMYSLDTISLGTGLAERLFEYPVSDIESAETFLNNSVSSSDDSLTQAYLKNVLALVDRDLQRLEDSITLAQYNKVLPRYFMQALIIAGCDSLESYFPDQYRQEKQVFDSFENTWKEVGNKPAIYRRNATYWDFRRTYYWYYRFGQL